jgi:phosphatidate cytidylyltransferase
MTKRIITGIVLLLLALPALLFSSTPVLTVYVAFLSLVAGYEVLNCIGAKKMLPIVLTALYICALIIPHRMLGSEYEMYALCASFAYVFFMFSASVFSHGKFDFATSAEASVCVVYSSLGFAGVLRLHDMPYGYQMFLLVLIIAFGTDIFAYFVGCTIGKHKLIPEVSPKKTVEGAIGGILGCVFVSTLYGIILSKFFDIQLSISVLCVLGFALSVVSQLGDLVLSQLKRRHSIKDFGKIFPGHGGVLDRFDSVIAVGFFLYMIWSAYLAFFVTL